MWIPSPLPSIGAFASVLGCYGFELVGCWRRSPDFTDEFSGDLVFNGGDLKYHVLTDEGLETLTSKADAKPIKLRRQS